ncbi:hypothetical protein E1A91_A08G084100v1 [Gossypium mustelinum]|uniref:CHY-type domain-containing protein n=1 Tax=Gossypium mustelinum TaxID=34275 RepID=A0A5D2Y5U3_GOSMU|nr:hypothetical protein E1A91_A08G084100v1 [Gossypium mustelinum]
MAGDSVISPQRSKDFGRLDHGCDHYKRRCKILAPCCNKTFPCRHCHNETSNSLSNPKDHHDLVRQDVKQVICSICNTQQEVAQVCSHCGVNMGEYFCDICKFYDDDITKGQFHCNDRGICRVGGRDKFFHCEKCGSCYMVDLRDNHFCVENSMKSYCPICFEYLFDSVKSTHIMKCGHTMHMECFSQMAKQNLLMLLECLRSINLRFQSSAMTATVQAQSSFTFLVLSAGNAILTTPAGLQSRPTIAIHTEVVIGS